MIARAFSLALIAIFVSTMATAQTAVTYGYDGLARVISATYAQGSNPPYTIYYSYDAAGNRTQVANNGNSPPNASVIVVPLNGISVLVVH